MQYNHPEVPPSSLPLLSSNGSKANEEHAKLTVADQQNFSSACIYWQDGREKEVPAMVLLL